MAPRQTVGPLLGGLFAKLAANIGATVVIEPKWKVVGQIIFQNGRKRYFRGSTVDLNPVGASDIAKDKDYAAFFMRRMGYPVAPGKAFFAPKFARGLHSGRSIDAAYRYAAKLGFPVVVKPNSGSQGVGVSKVHTKREFYTAIRSVFSHDRVALVQPPLPGNDYRIVVLDSRVISAYQRIPFNIVGDGRSNVRQLIRKRQTNFIEAGRDTMLRTEDPRIARNLARAKLNMRSVLPLGERLYLLHNANLSSGGDAVDVTASIHEGFREVAIRLTADMGLRICGVDLIVDGDIMEPPSTYWVLEVNAAPGLDHYVKTGKEQERIVEAMYLEVLKAMQ